MGRRFLSERRRDVYYRAAQREGLRSRAAYKLTDLAERFPLLRPGDRVLDLGGAPGGWSVVAREWVGPAGQVTAVDVRSIEPIPGVRFVRGSVEDPRTRAALGDAEFDVILSDMAPAVSGAYATDHARSVALVRSALEVARLRLRRGGRFAAKVFDGDLVPELVEELGREFGRVHRTKPPASRGPSSEIYLIGIGFRPSAPSGP